MFRQTISKIYKLVSKQDGQALLLVILSLVVALAVTVSIAARTLSSVSRVTKTDTITRVAAAAEGGAERFLGASDATLLTLSDGATSGECTTVGSNIGFDTASSTCIVPFDDGIGPDGVTTQALVKVDPYPATGTTTAEYKIKKNEVVELYLNKSQSSGTLCWKPSTTGVATNLFYSGYGDYSFTSWLVKGGVCPPTGCAGNSSGNNIGSAGWVNAGSVSNAFCTTAGYLYQTTINGLSNVVGLRVRSLVADSAIMFVGNTSLPPQGFSITSTGTLTTNSTTQETKIVKVIRSYEFLPAVFDFELYTGSGNLPN